MEDAFFPYVPDFLDTIHEHIHPLKGYTPQRDCSREDLLRRNRLGV
ncbi:MAG: hypothetical protein KGY99_10995 [Phycisphaerae bacterium]|nr:hypothetical protein [Phycisphaerae bacterium]